MPSPSVTIALGQTVSAEAMLSDFSLRGFITPANWTAGNVTFQISINDGVTFVPVYDALNALVTITSATLSRAYLFDPDLLARFHAVGRVKLVCSVAQAALVTVPLIYAMR